MDIRNLINKIAEIGSANKSIPTLSDVIIFKNYFDENNNLKEGDLDELDGNCTRRELLARFLFLNAVLDQGPDIDGVRELLCRTVNDLYRKEIRILHDPKLFFNSLNIVIDKISEQHDLIRVAREPGWQEANNSKKKYNLYMDNTTQTLSYAIFRWGTPLAVPLVLSKDDSDNPATLLDYLESFASSEKMTMGIKDNKRLGLGKAIGDKAAHLFAKWIVYTYPITRRADNAWDKYSYEIPFDSNVGRLLWRTGFLLECANESEYEEKDVIQKGKGKGGVNYIRATNIRGIGTSILTDFEKENYKKLCIEHLKSHSRAPAKYEIQKYLSAMLMTDKKYSIGDLDDGLIYIGTKFCFNHDNPDCDNCPLKTICVGAKDKKLITNYKT